MEKVDGRLIEMANRHLVITRALQHGFNAFLPVVDQGIDLILHREADNRLFKVQLKSRWTIAKKYLGRDLWIAFPGSASDWYLMPHDRMVQAAGALRVTDSQSWIEKGSYSSLPTPRLVSISKGFELEKTLNDNTIEWHQQQSLDETPSTSDSAPTLNS
ncbi:MAG TPA: hypothetical protein VIL65_08905 [Beijerinckiaceae bacterium]